MINDLTGDELEAGDSETLRFAVDGLEYEIDVSTSDAAEFRNAVAEYVRHGRRVGGRAPSKSKGKNPEAAAIRAWAAENGHDVPARGRIPADVAAAYRAASK